MKYKQIKSTKVTDKTIVVIRLGVNYKIKPNNDHFNVFCNSCEMLAYK